MTAATHNLVIEQGADLAEHFCWKNSAGVPIDLSGYTAKMQVRDTPEDDLVLLEASTTDSRITLGGVAGTIDLDLSAVITGAIDWEVGQYDLKLISASGFETRLLEGSVLVRPGVTRDV